RDRERGNRLPDHRLARGSHGSSRPCRAHRGWRRRALSADTLRAPARRASRGLPRRALHGRLLLGLRGPGVPRARCPSRSHPPFGADMTMDLAVAASTAVLAPSARGTHVIADLNGVAADVLNDEPYLRRRLQEILER